MKNHSKKQPQLRTVEETAQEEVRKDKRQASLKRRQEDRDGTILDVAKGLIYGDRNKVYRHPTENFDNIANLWNAYFTAISARPYLSNFLEMKCFRINKTDVAYMNILQKVARGAVAQDHIDTVVDIAGYAGCIERIIKNK